MKKVSGLLIVMLLFLFTTGCKKDSPVTEITACTDEQFPGEYFPAYPNSWWEYINDNNEIIKYQISNSYEDCEEKCRPVFLNMNVCVQGQNFVYTYYCGMGAVCGILSPIYSPVIDSTLICGISFSTFQTSILSPPRYRRVTVSNDTAIQIQNSILYQDVIIVRESDIYNDNHIYFDYFSKNIGLIKRDSVNINDSTDLIQILGLENYFIGD